MQVDFNLEDIRNHDNADEIITGRLGNHDFLARVLLWILNLDYQGKNTFKANELANWSNKPQNYCKWALKELKRIGLLKEVMVKRKSSFFLNKEIEETKLNEYIEIAKKTLGLK